MGIGAGYFSDHDFFSFKSRLLFVFFFFFSPLQHVSFKGQVFFFFLLLLNSCRKFILVVATINNLVVNFSSDLSHFPLLFR